MERNHPPSVVRIRDHDSPMGNEIMEMMKLGPDQAKANFTRVDVSGETAEVTLEQGTKESMETSTIKLRLEKGEWKVPPR